MSDYYFSPSTVKEYVAGTFVSHAVKKANEYGGFAGEDDIDPHNNSYDAYRHALLSAVMTQNIQQVAEDILISNSGIAYSVSQDQFHELSKVIGRDQAKAILDDHEDISKKPANMSMEDWQKEVNMDKWNNAVGQKEYFKWEQAIIKGETKDPLEKWIYDAVKRGETINNLDDNRVFTEEMELSFKNEKEQLLQYSQSFFVSKLQSLAPETQNLFNAVKGHLTEYHEKNGIPIEEAKLNAAYAGGGAELAISTIQKMMNIHIDRYIMVNMQGLQQLVDAVGGITVNNTLGFPISISDQEEFNTISIGVGEQTINGEEALVYSRMRYQDPEGDYGRQKRQREVIQKVVEKVLSLNSVSHYQSILKALSTNMQTNIDLSAKSIPSLLGYQDSFKTIETQQLRGEDAELQGTSYQIVTANHLLEIQNLLRTSLDKPKVTELETNAVLYEDIFGNRNNTGLGTGTINNTINQEDVE